MTRRVDDLQRHLEALTRANVDHVYQEEIQATVAEIQKELGIGTEPSLTNYSTKELWEEVVKRQGVKQVKVNVEQEAVLHVYNGENSKDYSVQGPVLVAFNHD
ncbi:BC1881 family protein [Sutcliffiella horikoshii]|uniref:BC1881 family protein n=1 Tax=Sutcliffiella horikoshii TaxID=79883 RepID=A0A5D4SET7_9BACI|nr:BC1881 family protein [Sutcliffiella horikoshii]TYS60482.1 BC1881 family protein [Sutcliffiella horikoshii]